MNRNCVAYVFSVGLPDSKNIFTVGLFIPEKRCGTKGQDIAGVTKEQIQRAREADLFSYLRFHEPSVLKRDGRITGIRSMTALFTSIVLNF